MKSETLRVFTRDEATALARKVLAIIPDPSRGVHLEFRSYAITRMANNRVLITDDGEDVFMQFGAPAGMGYGITVGLNQIDDTYLTRIVRCAGTLVAEQPAMPTFDRPPNPVASEEERLAYRQRPFIPVSLWHDRTASAIGSSRAEAVPRMLHRLSDTSLVGAATVNMTARAVCFVHPAGLEAYARETDAEVTMTARTTDGRASGWAGRAARDWGTLDLDAIADQAIQLAERGRNPVGLEPGHRTAILGPAAVAQVMRLVADTFDAQTTDLGGTALSKRPRGNKLRERVLDPRISLSSAPDDPEGGYAPIMGLSGFPMPKTTWVERGILRNLAYWPYYAIRKGKPYTGPLNFHGLRMDGGDGSSVEDLIASCEDGVYVNRFSDMQIVDRRSCLMTGVTRDGCFHVKNGRINRPIKNYRFLDSPFFFLNNILKIGAAARAALGYTPPQIGEVARWPWPPLIVPPVMVRDFNFIAMSDAV